MRILPISLIAACVLTASCKGELAQPAADAPVALLVDAAQPVIYDNDGVIESGYNDPFVMALASAGRITLRGMVSTGSYEEAKRNPPFSPLPDHVLVAERQWLIDVARRSGMRHIPDVTAGPSLSFESRRPPSGRIDDTVPFGSDAARLIVNEARLASAARPLIVLMGGQPTAVVDAYLLDPSIANDMLVLWQVGHKRADGDLESGTFNAAVDPWGTYIAFERLRIVAFPYSNDGDYTNDAKPWTPKGRLQQLPDTELRQVMMDAYLDRGEGNIDDFSYAYDADPIVALIRPDYIQQTKRMSFHRWAPNYWNPGASLPYFKDAPSGAEVAWSTSQAVATEQWWASMTDPLAWGR